MKFFLAVSLSLLLYGKTFSQNPGGIPGSLLWLKSEKLSVKSETIPSKLKNNYFNFNRIADGQSFKKAFKNIVSEQYSLFVVFKSDFGEERNVMTLKRGSTKVLVTNKAINNAKEMTYKGNVSKGIIVSYLNGNNDKNGKRKNSLVVDELFAVDEEGKEQLVELIYFPRMLSKLEKEKVETYLSIKYGISIAEKYDYLDSKGDKIWDVKENNVFGNHITGIGRDDLLNLYQKQSGNSLKDGIYMGFGSVDTTNTLNKYKLKDKSFLLWGDNGGKTVFTQDKDKRLKKMERIWKADVTGIIPQDSITTQLKISKKEFGYTSKSSDSEFLWLCINSIEYGEFNYADAKYVRQSSEDEDFIYFNDIAWDTDANGADIFTFIQGPDFMMEHREDFTCESDNGSVSVKLIGGTLPYTLNFDGKELTTENDIVYFNDITAGTYDLKVTEAKGSSITADIVMSPIGDTTVTISPVWYLNESQEVTVIPTINSKTPQDLSFEWTSGGKRISSDKELTTKTSGDYILTVSNTEGCKKSIPFKVEGRNDNMVSGWAMYPNPARSGEQFSVDFNLEKESQVTVSINTMEGKQVLYKNLGSIKTFSYKESVTTRGVYLITLKIDDTAETVKLIVH